MAVKKNIQPIPAKRNVADGRVFIKEFQPSFETVSAGGIVLTESAVLGKASLSRDGQRVLTPDKSVVYGVVTGCGLKAERSSIKPIPREDQGDFPLPIGTLVKVSKASADHVVSPGELAFPTWDVLEWVKPGEPRPSWAPTSVSKGA